MESFLSECFVIVILPRRSKVDLVLNVRYISIALWVGEWVSESICDLMNQPVIWLSVYFARHTWYKSCAACRFHKFYRELLVGVGSFIFIIDVFILNMFTVYTQSA